MEPSDLFPELNRTEVEMILADLELALTFADRAAHAQDADTRTRTTRSAADALHTIEHLLPKCSPNPEQMSTIQKNMAELKRRLASLGERFD